MCSSDLETFADTCVADVIEVGTDADTLELGGQGKRKRGKEN